MRFKRAILYLTIAVMLLVAVGCQKSGSSSTSGGAAATNNSAPVKLTWATAQTSTTPTYKDTMVPWAKWIEKKSGGRLQIQFQPDETVLKAPEILDGVKGGVADMGDFQMGIYAGRFPLNEYIMLPLLFEYPASRAAGLTATELVKKYPQLEKEFEAAGVKLLGFMPMGAGQIHTTKKPIRTMEDLKGVVIECHSGRYVTEAIKTLGATPASISPAEGYDALAKGIVQGMIGEYEFAISSGFYQLFNYTTEVGSLGMSFEAVVMNLDKWNSLPQDLQQLLVGEGMKAFMEVHSYRTDKNEIAFREQIEQKYLKTGKDPIYVLPDAEKEKWEKIIKPSWDLWVKDAEAKGAPGKEILNDAINLAKKYAYDTYPKDYPEQMLKEWGQQ